MQSCFSSTHPDLLKPIRLQKGCLTLEGSASCPHSCLGLLHVPGMGELLVLGAAILQELSSSCYLATVYEISGLKTSEKFKQGFAETGGFSLGVLMWGCRWRDLALQWGLSNICLASEEVSFTHCYVCPLLKPSEGMEATKQLVLGQMYKARAHRLFKAQLGL